MVPPKAIDSSAKVGILACIDPRYTATLEKYLVNDKELHGDYDMFALAGAELGAITHLRWRKVFFEHVKLMVELHGITSIYCFSHLDCGFYKHVHSSTTDTDAKLHLKELKRMKKLLLKHFPNLSFRGYLMDLEGNIKVMVKG